MVAASGHRRCVLTSGIRTEAQRRKTGASSFRDKTGNVPPYFDISRTISGTKASAIQTPLFSLHTNGADGALRIQQRHKTSPVGQAVFEDDTCDAVIGEPFGDRVALTVER